MPELPEVESARRHIAKHCLNKKLTRVDFTECGGHARDGLEDEIVIDESLLSNKGRELIGRALVGTFRKGKYIVWELGKPGETSLVFHFGMTGNFRIRGVPEHIHYYKSSSIKPDDDPKADEEAVKSQAKRQKKTKKDGEEEGGDDEVIVGSSAKWPPRFTKALFHFDGGIEVAFTDPRRLGRLHSRKEPRKEHPIVELAADPLHEMPTAEEFRALVAKAGTREIKTVLLDQSSIVSGIGNYLADECLHQARIHPCQRVHELEEDEINRLRECILKVCTIACQCLQDKQDFPSGWLFHGRWDPKHERDKNPNRLHIEEIKVGGRTTFFEPERQVLRKNGSKSRKSSSGGDRSPAKSKASTAAEPTSKNQAAKKSQTKEAAVNDKETITAQKRSRISNTETSDATPKRPRRTTTKAT